MNDSLHASKLAELDADKTQFVTGRKTSSAGQQSGNDAHKQLNTKPQKRKHHHRLLQPTSIRTPTLDREITVGG